MASLIRQVQAFLENDLMFCTIFVWCLLHLLSNKPINLRRCCIMSLLHVASRQNGSWKKPSTYHRTAWSNFSALALCTDSLLAMFCPSPFSLVRQAFDVDCHLQQVAKTSAPVDCIKIFSTLLMWIIVSFPWQKQSMWLRSCPSATLKRL